MDERLDALERRVAGLERDVATLLSRAPVRPAPAAPISAASPPPAPTPAREVKPMLDAEAFLGGRVLLAVGALALLLGVGFFIKYAFDNGWIGPLGRVAVGLLAGAAFVALAEVLRRRGRRFYAEGLTGLGGGILYLSLWAAGNGFHLVPVGASFFAMVAVTAALVAIGVSHDSEVAAAYAICGGFITPLLNATDRAQPVELLTYIAILDAAFVFLPLTRRWPRIEATAFVLTQLYVLAVYSAGELSLGPFLGFASLYLALFAWQPVMKAMRGAGFRGFEGVLSIATALAYYAALHAELYDAHRYWLTAAVVVFAAAALLVALLSKVAAARSVYASIALALVTGGVAIAFAGDTVAVLWGVEGALLGLLGIRQRNRVIQSFGFASFVFGVLRMMAIQPEGGALFANARFLTLAIYAVGLFVVHLAGAAEEEATPFSPLYRAYEPVAHVFAVVALSYELYNWTQGNELSLTLLWLAYAAALFAVGIVRRSALERWQAFALLAVAICKAFIVDMGAVNPGIRIVSFLALGSVMLVVSYAYQRYAKRAEQTPS